MKLPSLGRSPKQLAQWHRWFAWFFVTTNDGDTVWLETVERRLMRGVPMYDEDGWIVFFEYRRIKGGQYVTDNQVPTKEV